MIELMKNMEEPEQAESVCDPEQTIDLEETERLMSEYDPEHTPAFDGMDGRGTECIPEQTTAQGIEGNEPAVDKDAAVEGDAAAEKDTTVEEDAVVDKDAAVEGNAAAEKDTAVEEDAAAEKDTAVEEESGRSKDLPDSGVFVFDEMEFRTPSELARYFQSYADDSRRALSRKVRQLYADKEHLLPEFEAWLIAIGKEKELNAWKRKIQGMR